MTSDILSKSSINTSWENCKLFGSSGTLVSAFFKLLSIVAKFPINRPTPNSFGEKYKTRKSSLRFVIGCWKFMNYRSNESHKGTRCQKKKSRYYHRVSICKCHRNLYCTLRISAIDCFFFSTNRRYIQQNDTWYVSIHRLLL